MDIRTTCSNTAHQTQFDRMEAYGITLLEISSHMGARPKCAKVQGRIFDKANKSTKYPHFNTTSYGQPDGIFGINCRHKFYPFIDGVNTQTYFPYNEEENAKAYKLSQEQRQLERNVRSAKRECTSLKTLNDKEELAKASAKLKASQNKLKSFCSDNDLSYKADRTSIPGYNKSISSKVVQANKVNLQKQIDNASESGIIKTIEKGKQQKHILGTNNYTEGRSYLSVSENQAQNIINEFSGTGTKIGQNKEKITADKIIGVNVNPKYNYKTLTDKAVIHYSNKGTHIVPTANELKKQSITTLSTTAKKVAMEYYDMPEFYSKFQKEPFSAVQKESMINALLQGKQSKTNLIKDIKSMEKKILKSRGEIK